MINVQRGPISGILLTDDDTGEELLEIRPAREYEKVWEHEEGHAASFETFGAACLVTPAELRELADLLNTLADEADHD